MSAVDDGSSEPLPPYIYGREAGPNEKVWTESAVRTLAARSVAAPDAPEQAQDRAAAFMRGHDAGWQSAMAQVAAGVERPQAMPAELAAFGATLAAQQRPLDADMAKVLHDNAWDLYATDAATQPVGECKCDCRACLRDRDERIGGLPVEMVRYVLCASCGNKRCPHATDHRHACTNSNEPGQPGSVYTL